MAPAARVNAIVSARFLRNEGRPDLAAALLEREGELAHIKTAFMYLRLRVYLEDCAALQAAIQRLIDCLPEQAIIPADYLKPLCIHAQYACLDETWLERLAAKSWKTAKQDPSVNLALSAMNRRLDVRRRMAAEGAPAASLITLGLNCMPWNVPCRWGLRRQADFIDLLTPFAQVAHTLALMISMLRDDFKDYCAEETLTWVTTKGGHQTPLRRDAQASWNHNLGSYWVEDGFARLRQMMAVQIANFRAACRRDNAVFIMTKALSDFPARPPLEFLETLNQALERHTGQRRNRLVLLNKQAETASQHWVDDWTLIVNCPFPSASYVWYDDEAADTDEGFAYEQSHITAIMHALSHWGLTTAARAPSAALSVRA